MRQLFGALKKREIYIRSSVFAPYLYLWLISWLWHREVSHRGPAMQKRQSPKRLGWWWTPWSMVLKKRKQVNVGFWLGVFCKNLDMNWNTWIHGKTIGGLPGGSLYRVKNKTDVLKTWKFLEMLEFWPGQNWGDLINTKNSSWHTRKTKSLEECLCSRISPAQDPL